MGTKEHKEKSERHLDIAVLTLSTTRSISEDESGRWICDYANEEGHHIVFHTVIPDGIDIIRQTVSEILREHSPDALLLNGGTGLARSDVTIEAVQPLFEKELTAFGALFAMLSYDEIKSAAVMSRATAGIIGDTSIFCMPGSLKAVKLACKKIIFPELGHINYHLRKG